jgi:hypothetical protein
MHGEAFHHLHRVRYAVAPHDGTTAVSQAVYGMLVHPVHGMNEATAAVS